MDLLHAEINKLDRRAIMMMEKGVDYKADPRYLRSLVIRLRRIASAI